MKQPRSGATEAPAAARPNTEKSSLLAAAQGRKGDDAAPTATAKPASGLAATFALFVISSLGNRLFQKLQTIPMYNYPITVNIVSTAVYVPVCFAYIIPASLCLNPSPITAEEQAIPKSVFAVMGALDCLSSVMLVLAVNYVPNASTLVLLQQAAIPISMVISALAFVGVRYDRFQILGAAVVLLGIGVVLSPQLGSTDSEASSGTVLWSLVTVAACVPMCLSSVYKEKALGEQDVGVIFLNGWVAVFQTVMSLPLAIPSAWATHLPLSELPDNVVDGFSCVRGIGSVGVVQPEPGLSYDDDDLFASNPSGYDLLNPNVDTRRPDDCATAPAYVTLYIIFNLLYNVATILMLKQGGSNVLYLASTVLVPISNVMFALPCMPQHQPVHTTDVYGLVVIMLGLTLYRAGQQIASRLSERWCSLQTRRPRLYSDLEGDVPTPILREVAQSPGVFRRARTDAARTFRADQLEMLQPIYEQQERQARRRLVKTNAQIRHTLLRRLGFSPDTSGVPIPGSRRQSPGDWRRTTGRSPPLPASSFVPLSERRRARSFQARSSSPAQLEEPSL